MIRESAIRDIVRFYTREAVCVIWNRRYQKSVVKW